MLSSDWRVYIATLWHVTAVGVAVLAFAAPVLYEKEYAPRIETPWGWPMLTLGSWNVCCTAIFFVVCALSDVWPHWEGLRVSVANRAARSVPRVVIEQCTPIYHVCRCTHVRSRRRCSLRWRVVPLRARWAHFGSPSALLTSPAAVRPRSRRENETFSSF